MSTDVLEPVSIPPMGDRRHLEMTVIEPTRSWGDLRLGEVWRARELIFFLMWRDVKVRYKQTAVGAGWAVLQPLITVLIFSLLLGHYAHLTVGVPYPIFIFAGLLPWTYFAYSITQSGKSLVDNEKLITKIYFPRLALPIATTFTGLPDFAVGCVVYAVMMAIFGVPPSWRVVFVPLFLLLAILTAMGVGFWLSGLNVRYRDVKYILPFLTQIWMFASPVVYPGYAFSGHSITVAGISVKLQTLYSLNPMVGVINGFRWALLGPLTVHRGTQTIVVSQAPTLQSMMPSLLVTAVLLVSGVYFFKHMDKTFADVI